MARNFVVASSQYLQRAGGVVSAAPMTMSCWFNTNDDTAFQVLMMLGTTSSNNNYFFLRIDGAQAGDLIAASQRDNAGAIGTAVTTTGITVNTWHHGAAVFTSNSSRAAFIDGGSKGTETTALGATSAPNSTAIGRLERLSPGQYMSGLIAEAGIWNVALTDEEVASLARGASPLLVRPTSLVACWPLIGRASPEPDVRGGANLTLINAPTTGDHCRIVYPDDQMILGMTQPTGVVGRRTLYPRGGSRGVA